MKFTYIKLLKNNGKRLKESEKQSGFFNGKFDFFNKENDTKEKEFYNKGSILDKKNGPIGNKRKMNFQKNINDKNGDIKENTKEETPVSRKNALSDFFKKALKKNQVALFAIALMLITSGYMNYTNNLKMAALGDATLVSTNVVENNNETDVSKNTNNEIDGKENANSNNEVKNTNNMIEKDDDDDDEEDDDDKDEESDDDRKEKNNNVKKEDANKITEGTEGTENTTETSSKVNSEEYFAQTRLERNKMYSQMIETYQKILENDNISTEQKNTASEEIKNINNRLNAIATIETLIKGKGISEIVVLVNGDVIDAIVKADDNISQEQVAQITNIVSRELNAEIENIHITTHK